MAGRILGMPARWEPSPRMIARNFWNADDGRLFPPKVFGIGWDVNFHELLRRMRINRAANE